MNCCAFVFAVLAVGAHSAVLPSSIKICKQSSSDVDQCLAGAIMGALETFVKGNKELAIPKVDPLFVKSIDIKGNGGSVDLEQTYTDLNVHGLSKTKIQSAKMNLKECKLNLEALAEKVELKSQLKLSGKLLLFTLNGGGRSDITLSNTKIVLEMPCERVVKDGKNHLKIKDVSLDLQPEKIEFDIENLIDGNEQLSAEVLKVMNENDQEIFKELKKDYENTFSQIFQTFAIAIFDKIPEDEVFPQ